MKKKGTFLVIVFLLTLIACNSDESTTQNNNPTIKANATYEVILEEAVVYAQGLSHESLNSTQSTNKELLLDVYYPNNNEEKRPVYMFIHGGGFVGGNRNSQEIVDAAQYFASRGWVFISISYRVKNDIGTVPQEWIDFSSSNNFPDASLASQFLAIYPAHRDAKAALRWITTNANTYHIDTNHITVGGVSAGAITSITLGVSNQEDFRDELSLQQDPTLQTTHLDQGYKVQTIIDFWGAKIGLDAIERIYGHQRFDANDADLLIVHGTEDKNPNTPYSSAIDLMEIYRETGANVKLIPLEGRGHGAIDAIVNGKNLFELSFDFITTQQELNIE